MTFTASIRKDDGLWPRWQVRSWPESKIGKIQCSHPSARPNRIRTRTGPGNKSPPPILSISSSRDHLLRANENYHTQQNDHDADVGSDGLREAVEAQYTVRHFTLHNQACLSSNDMYLPAADALCSTWRMKTDALRWRKQNGSDADMVLKGLS